MRKALLLAVVVLGLGASEAGAHTTIIEPPESHYPYQRWVDEARVPTPNATMWVVEDASSCAGLRGCTDTEAWIWLRPDENTFTRGAFLHELGHAFDHYALPEWGRLRFREISGHFTMPWSPLGVDELFAETYRQCAWPERARGESPIAGLQRPLARATICQMIRNVYTQRT